MRSLRRPAVADQPRATTDALAWRGCAEQLAARLRVLGEHSPALDNFDRMVEAAMVLSANDQSAAPDGTANVGVGPESAS